eukprot:CAMPEP_0185161866 /NCGR_PEP_ID=MMETSP1139-20130426/5623_1 /TAXON_ID=298111 /ORGANISM="Pavlova sp., Strain CCMP459" /LENGTH=46 /DNA_ID= /DNA_START= /DNA_END= /DNA_ORIENTATION=
MDDPSEAMKQILVGRHCLEETAKKFEETRQQILRNQGKTKSKSKKT